VRRGGGGDLAYNIAKTGVPGEVFAHGKVPLAFSWRCYTSRAYGLTKTGCAHDCARHPGGMEIKTVDGEPLFTINGTSILSAKTYSLVTEVEDLKAMGVARIRVSPEPAHTARVLEVFKSRILGELGPAEGLRGIRGLTDGEVSNGWYHGRAGKEYVPSTLIV